MLGLAARRAPHDDDDDGSDEEVRWAGDTANAWDELLKCYRQEVAAQHAKETEEQQQQQQQQQQQLPTATPTAIPPSGTPTQLRAGVAPPATQLASGTGMFGRSSSTLPSQGGTPFKALSTPQAIPGAAAGDTQDTEDREFLEFFPEWRTDGNEAPVPLTPTVQEAPQAPGGARKRKRDALGGGGRPLFPSGPRGADLTQIRGFSPTPRGGGATGVHGPASQIYAFTPSPKKRRGGEGAHIDRIEVSMTPGKHGGGGAHGPAMYTGEGHLKDPIELVADTPRKARSYRHGGGDVICDFDTDSVATPNNPQRQDHIRERIEMNRQAEARIQALAQLGMERNPDAHCLLFTTTRQKQMRVFGQGGVMVPGVGGHGQQQPQPQHTAGPGVDGHPGAAAPTAGGGLDEILDAGPAPFAPHPPDNAWLRRIIAGERLGPHGEMVPRAPTPRQSPWQAAAQWFKVQHAPLKFKAGQLSGFLGNRVRVLSHQHMVFCRSDANAAPAPSQHEHALHLRVLSLAGVRGSGRCVRCHVVAGRAPQASAQQQRAVLSLNDLTRAVPSTDLSGTDVQVVLTSHQITNLALTVGDEIRVHPPYNVRSLGPSRRVIMGADFILAVKLASLAEKSVLPALSMALVTTSATGGSEQIGRPASAARLSEWPEVTTDEWELPAGTWAKVDAMLAGEA